MSESKKSTQIKKQPYSLINIYITKDYLHFTADEIKTGIRSKLTMDRKNLQIYDQNILIKTIQPLSSYGIIGIISIYGKKVLFYISDAVITATINQAVIYKIKGVQSLLIDNDDSAPTAFEQDCITQSAKYFQQSMYFSYHYDLTSTKNYKFEKAQRFWWNFNILKPFYNRKDWCLRIIQGYVGSFQIQLKNKKELECALIARREWIRGGTRYNHRGIDDEGNAANFVESELILRVDTNSCSHIQIRGSVPIHWQQVGIRATSELTKDFETSKKGFYKHFERINSYYGDILCVNLMSNEKSNEFVITKNYEEQTNLFQFKL